MVLSLTLGQGALLAISVFCILAWITEPIPSWVTGLIGLVLFAAIFSLDLALVGFWSPAMWLVLFGLIMGEAIAESGLGNTANVRLLQYTLSEDADIVDLYRRLLVILCLGSFLFGVIVPSNLVRIFILAPILLETSTNFSSKTMQRGIFFGPLLATYYGSTGVLTAGLQNIIVAGIADPFVDGAVVTWGNWLLTMFPIMGIGRVLVVILVTYYVFPPDRTATYDMDTTSVTFGRPEIRTAVFLAIGIFIWATDSIHGFHPVYGALVVAVLSVLPYIGVLDVRDLKGLEYTIAFFLGAVFAIAEGFSRTGLSDRLGSVLSNSAPQSMPLYGTIAFVFVASVLAQLVMEGLAAASVITPINVAYAQQVGLPVEYVVKMESVAFNMAFLPHQSAALVVILAQGEFDTPSMLKITVPCFLLTAFVLAPLQILLFAL